MAIQVFDFKNADIGSPIRTIVKEYDSSSGASHTADLTATTVAGDIVIDYVTTDDSHSLTVGAGQTQVSNGTTGSSGGDFRFGSSHETASGVSTTMSWTVSGGNHVMVAVPVTGTTATEVVGLDMIPHKNKLIALGIQGKSHVISTSTDGATWTGIPTSQTKMTLINGAIEDSTTVAVDSAS